MASKTKKFINKKTALKFSLIHRSQQDPLYYDEDEGSKYVLQPNDEYTRAKTEMIPSILREPRKHSETASNKQPTTTSAASLPIVQEYREVDELGLPIDGYDYSKHLATIGQGGTFINASGEIERIEMKPSSKANEEEEEEERLFELPSQVLSSGIENARLLEAITLKPDNMDEEMKAILELAESGEENDFPEEEEEEEALTDARAEEGDLTDDYFAGLLVPVTKEAAEVKASEDDDDAFDFDAHMDRLMKQAQMEDEESMVDSEPFEEVAREKRDVDLHFEAVLAKEYEEEEEEEEEEGENGELFEKTLNDFLEERNELKSLGNVNKPPKKEELNIDLNYIEERMKKLYENDDYDDPDGVLKQWGTYKEKPSEVSFDCQTILTTLSTKDNLPKMIGYERKNPKQHVIEKDREEEEEEEKERISLLTEEELKNEIATLAINAMKAEALVRKKNETAEEKKLRKAIVKEAKKERRVEKKTTKEVFKAERAKHLNAVKGVRIGVAEFKM